MHLIVVKAEIYLTDFIMYSLCIFLTWTPSKHTHVEPMWVPHGMFSGAQMGIPYGSH